MAYKSNPTSKECCSSSESCQLGSDNFDRVSLGTDWKVISGTGQIVNNHIEVDGKVATTICHPADAIFGSFRASFDLVNMRTISRFEIGCGNPNSSPYWVRWEPLNKDTPSAKIRVTVQGDGLPVVFDHVWTNSVDTWPVQVCYEPGALLRGGVGIPPSVDTCIVTAGAAACYDSVCDSVGNFFFKKGNFDNWNYYKTILDDFGCDPCGCFCFRRSGTEKTFSCYPKKLYLNFSNSGVCPVFDNKVIEMNQGLLSPTDNYPEKVAWLSPIESCQGYQFAFVLNCTTIVKNGTDWLQALSLRLTDSNYVDSTVLFNWITPSVNLSTRDADYVASTCDPLSLVFPGLRVNSFFGPCGPPSPPGTMGHFLFCCPAAPCLPTPAVVTYGLTVTA